MPSIIINNFLDLFAIIYSAGDCQYLFFKILTIALSNRNADNSKASFPVETRISDGESLHEVIKDI